MSELKEKVKEIVLETLSKLNNGLELYSISFSQKKLGWILQIQLQADHLISMDEIIQVNELLSMSLDRIADLFPESYTLDVSSAGLERAIRNDHELTLALDKDIKVSCYRKYHDKKSFIGKLTRFDADKLQLKLVNGNNEEIPRNYIAHLNYALIL
ncbi:MAG: hypothetical protein M3Z38_05275 [Bombilactobacillus mellifer]|nr:hypothetical protein [Bombilactobacillus mellifer]